LIIFSTSRTPVPAAKEFEENNATKAQQSKIFCFIENFC
jgi:hypothetical protein